MKRTLQIFIAALPLIFSFSTSDPTLAIRFLALSVLVSSVLIYYFVFNRSIYREVLTHHAMKAFGLVIVAYVFSATYNGFDSESIYNILKLYLSYVFTIILTQFVLKNGYKSILNSFVFFSFFVSAIYGIQVVINHSEIINSSLEWKGNIAFDHIAGSMGHKNLLSSIQFLMLPVLIYLLFVSKRYLRILSGIAILLIFITILHTQTRAVLFAIVIFIIALFFILRKTMKRIHFISIILVFTVLFSGGYGLMKYTNEYDSFTSEIRRTLEGNTSNRIKLYSSTLKMISNNPFFGVGPGNWKIEIWKYDLYSDSFGKSFAQRPHNDFLWVFAEGGLFAGISYILLFLILLRDSYFLHKNRKKEDGVFYALLFSALLGYGFISFFDFPIERFAHSIIFFTLASFIIAGKIKSPKIKMSKSFMLLLICVSFFCVYLASLRYICEIHAKNAIFYKERGKWSFVIKAIDRAYNQNYYQMENTSTPLLWYRGIAYFKQKKYNLAFEDFKNSFKINPNHIHVINNLATSYQVKGDTKTAKKYYHRALKMNPTFKETRVNLAAIIYNEGKYTKSLDMILKSKVDPYVKRKKNNDNYDPYLKTIVNSWINSVYFKANDKEKTVLKVWKQNFEKTPSYAANKSSKIYKIRKNDDIDYLTALLIYENNTTRENITQNVLKDFNLTENQKKRIIETADKIIESKDSDWYKYIEKKANEYGVNIYEQALRDANWSLQKVFAEEGLKDVKNQK